MSPVESENAATRTTSKAVLPQPSFHYRPHNWYLQPTKYVLEYMKRNPKWIQIPIDSFDEDNYHIIDDKNQNRHQHQDQDQNQDQDQYQDEDQQPSHYFDADLPFHVAIRENASLDMIQCLYRSYPHAIHISGQYGWVPLHVAIACTVPIEIFQFVLDSNPLATKCRDKYGNYPINILTDDDTMKWRKIQEHPQSRKQVKQKQTQSIKTITARTNDNNTKEAIMTQQRRKQQQRQQNQNQIQNGQCQKLQQSIRPNNIIQKTMNEYNNDNDNITEVAVVDIAIDNNYTNTNILAIQYIKRLIDVDPNCVRYVGEDGTILHRAVLRGFSLPLFHTIITLYPQSTRIYFPSTNCSSTSSYSGISSRETLSMKTIRTTEAIHNDSKLPIHCIHPGVPHECIQYLCDSCPESLLICCSKGTALHIAIVEGCTISQIQCIVYTNPESVKVKDSDGNLPIHLLPMYLQRKQCELYDLLVQSYPESLIVQNNAGHVPLHTMILQCASVDGTTVSSTTYSRKDTNDVSCNVYYEQIIQNIIHRCPTCCMVCDTIGRLPLHIQVGQLGSRHDNVVRYILDAYPMGIMYASMNGKLPLHIAIAALKSNYCTASTSTGISKVSTKQRRVTTTRTMALIMYLFDKYPQAIEGQKSGYNTKTRCFCGSSSAGRPRLDNRKDATKNMNENENENENPFETILHLGEMYGYSSTTRFQETNIKNDDFSFYNDDDDDGLENEKHNFTVLFDFIIERYPQILHVPIRQHDDDDGGMLPLHVAYNQGREVIQMRRVIASKNPLALLSFDNSDDNDDDQNVDDDSNNESSSNGYAEEGRYYKERYDLSSSNSYGHGHIHHSHRHCRRRRLGYTPIHIGCMNQRINQSLDDLDLEYMFNLCPEAATTRTHQGNCLPLFLACQYNASLDVILYLLEHSLDELLFS